MESQAYARKLQPKVPDEEMGGQQDIDLIAWRLSTVLANQPKGQIS